MADISAIFGILLTLGIVFPGLLTAVWLLFPVRVARAQTRLTCTPGRCVFLGAGVAALILVPSLFAWNVGGGGVKFVISVFLAAILALAALGAAGLTARLGAQLQTHSPALTPAGAFVRGAVVLELAAFFPMLGWFIFLPMFIVASLGAALFAVLNWMPRAPVVPPPPAP